MKKIPNKYFVLIIVILFILTVYYAVDNEGRKHTEPILPEANLSRMPVDLKTAVEEIAVRVKEEKKRDDFFSLLPRNKITADTPLVFQTYYEKSKEISEYITGMPSSFVGLTVEQLTNALQEWEIKEFKPKSALILYQSKNDLLPEDKNRQHLGIKDGKVVIFHGGTDKKNKVVKKETDIDIIELPEREILKLKKGIELNTEEELFTILEGLLSYKQD